MARPAILPGHPVNASTGGGFSNLYPQPKYQKIAAGIYFHEHDAGFSYYSRIAIDSGNISHTIDPDYLAGNSGGIYNRIGRGYPDVSAIGIHGTVSCLECLYVDVADQRLTVHHRWSVHSITRNQLISTTVWSCDHPYQ